MVKKRILIEVKNVVITALLISLYFMYLGPLLVEKNLINHSPDSTFFDSVNALYIALFIVVMMRALFIALWKNSGPSFSIGGWCLSIYHAMTASVWLFILGVAYVLSPEAVVTLFFLTLVIVYIKVILKRTPKMVAEDFRKFYQACVKGSETFLPAFVKGCKEFYGILKGRDMKPFFLLVCLSLVFLWNLIELLQWALDSLFR